MVTCTTRNVLSVADDPLGWRAIDPFGIVGEREIDVGAMLRNPYLNPPVDAAMQRKLERRLAIFHEMLGFERPAPVEHGRGVLRRVGVVDALCGQRRVAVGCGAGEVFYRLVGQVEDQDLRCGRRLKVGSGVDVQAEDGLALVGDQAQVTAGGVEDLDAFDVADVDAALLINSHIFGGAEQTGLSPSPPKRLRYLPWAS